MNPRNPSLPCKTATQERFCQLIAAGGRVKESYLKAGYAKGRHAAQNANKLKNKLRPRITFLKKQRAADEVRAREAAIHASAIKKEWVLEVLQRNIERALRAKPVLDREGKETGEYRYDGVVVNRAVELIGKELGMFRNDRDENSFRLDRQRLERMTEAERIAENAELLAQAKQRIREYRETMAKKGEQYSTRLNGGQRLGCPDREESQDPPSQEGGGDAGTQHRRPRRNDRT
jgi:hypothetical protein